MGSPPKPARRSGPPRTIAPMNATTTETDRATGAQAIRNPLTPDVVERLLKRAPVAGSETRTISTPFTGEPLAEIPVGDAADVDRAFDRARFAQAAWARVPVNSRREVLHRFHDLVLTHQGQLMDVVQAETGKNRASRTRKSSTSPSPPATTAIRPKRCSSPPRPTARCRCSVRRPSTTTPRASSA